MALNFLLKRKASPTTRIATGRSRMLTVDGEAGALVDLEHMVGKLSDIVESFPTLSPIASGTQVVRGDCHYFCLPMLHILAKTHRIQLAAGRLCLSTILLIQLDTNRSSVRHGGR